MSDKIMKQSLSGEEPSEVVVGHGIVGLKTMEVDHVTNKVYWYVLYSYHVLLFTRVMLLIGCCLTI